MIIVRQIYPPRSDATSFEIDLVSRLIATATGQTNLNLQREIDGVLVLFGDIEKARRAR